MRASILGRANRSSIAAPVAASLKVLFMVTRFVVYVISEVVVLQHNISE